MYHRATVLPEEEEEGLWGIYRKNSTGDWLKEPPVKRNYHRQFT